MNKRNYQVELDRKLAKLEHRPRLLLHSCCGPCSSYVLEYLTQYFDIDIFFFNPNVRLKEEYELRLSEQLRLLREAPFAKGVGFIPAPYEPEAFEALVRGMESEKEGGARCSVCFDFRLDATAKKAAELGYEYFTTTLTVSRHKNAELINTVGEKLSGKYGVSFLCADFKKRNGCERSQELSRIYSLYRQSYCGCGYGMQIGDI